MTGLDSIAQTIPDLTLVAHAAVCDYIADSARTISLDKLRDLALFIIDVAEAVDDVPPVSYFLTSAKVFPAPSETTATVTGGTFSTTWTGA